MTIEITNRTKWMTYKKNGVAVPFDQEVFDKGGWVEGRGLDKPAPPDQQEAPKAAEAPVVEANAKEAPEATEAPETSEAPAPRRGRRKKASP